MKTAIQIIEETAEYYGQDPKRRGVTPSGVCSYVLPDGRMCAVGRCTLPLNEIIDENARDMIIGNDSVMDLESDVIDAALKPEYRGHSSTLWADLQQFHDLSENFNATGLSSAGERHLVVLIHKYRGD